MNLDFVKIFRKLLFFENVINLEYSSQKNKTTQTLMLFLII